MLLLLMKMALSLILALIVFVAYTDSQVSVYADNIPIAGLFDHSHDEEIRAAFSHAIANENKRLQGTLKLNALLNKLDMKSSYSFGNRSLERIQTLLDCLSMDKYFVRTRLLRVQDVEDAYHSLQRLDSRNRDEKRIILDLPTEDCEDLLHRQTKGIPGMLHHYLLVRLEIKDVNFVRIFGSFRNGGIKVTGLRLVDRVTQVMRGFLSGWSKLDPDLYKGAGNKISSEAALAVDAVGVISHALQRMISEKPTVFKQTLRNGKVYNNGSQGIDCDDEPVPTFVHGQALMKAMREVELTGLTGVIKFDEFGLRRDYKLDVFDSTLHRGLAQIGSWHSETGLQIRSIDIIRPPKGNHPFEN